jgi:HK97 family phage prohead protease
MQRELERRSYKNELRAEASEPGAPPRIAGYAALYNSMSELLGGAFYERIAPGVFKRALERMPDVRLLINHDPSLILGRTRANTLRLAEDERGLQVDNDPPDTQPARDILVSLRRGDIDQMSFGFYTLADEWTEEEVHDKVWPVRTLLDLDIDDVSIVTYPAYQATQVQVRMKPRTIVRGLSVARRILQILEKTGT